MYFYIVNKHIKSKVGGMLKKIKRFIRRTLLYLLPVNLLVALVRVTTDFDKKKRRMLQLVPQIKPLEGKNSPRYIVSLTSYGKRLSATAPYTVITLLHQSVKPDKVVLWVGHDDKDNIPEILWELEEKGLELRFCDDLMSYTKIIPSLLEFHEDYIITADDDVYYPENWLERLVTLSEERPNKIICHRAHGIKVDKNRAALPYKKWDRWIEPAAYFALRGRSVPRHRPEAVFPTGVGGVLYPPGCFHKDVADKELFMKLAPRADDIWLWAMAVINKEYFGGESPYVVIPGGYSENLQFVEPEQQESALWSYNVRKHGNDTQFTAVVEHCPQIKEVLGRIGGVVLP
jgi:hypothetical protein